MLKILKAIDEFFNFFNKIINKIDYNKYNLVIITII